jgi:adenine-specific DNA methylase
VRITSDSPKNAKEKINIMRQNSDRVKSQQSSQREQHHFLIVDEIKETGEEGITSPIFNQVK